MPLMRTPQQRVILKRRISRPTQQRRVTAINKALEQKRRVETEEQTRELKRDLSNLASTFTASLNNISNIDEQANQYFNKVVVNVPPDFRQYFKDKLKRQINDIKTKQSSLKNKFQKDLSFLEVERKRNEQRLKKAKTSSRIIQLKSALENIKGKQEAYKELIGMVERGDVLNRSRALRYATEKANIRGRQEFAKLLRREEIKKAKEKSIDINKNIINFIEREVKKPTTFKTPIKDIQATFGISKSQAKEIKKVIIKNKERDKSIGAIYGSIERGARLTPKDFAELNVPVEEKAKILRFQKRQEAKSKRALDFFSDNFADRLSMTRNLFNSFSKGFREKFKEAEKDYNTYVRQKKRIGDKSVPLQTTQIKAFEKLNDVDKNRVLTYSMLKTIQKDIPKNIATINKTVKENLENLRLLQKNIPNKEFQKLLASSKILRSGDIRNLQNLYKMSESKLKDIVLKGDYKTVNKFTRSYNKIYENIRLFEEKRFQNLLKSYNRKLLYDIKQNQKLIPTDRKITIPIFLNKIRKPLKISESLLRLKAITTKARRGDSISLEEYKNYKDSINDSLAIDKASKTTFKKIAKQYGRNSLKDYVKTFYDVGKFTAKTSRIALNYVWQDIKFITKVLFKTLKFTGTLGWNFLIDNISSSLFVKTFLPQRFKSQLFERTRKQLEPIYRVSKSVKEFMSNVIKKPELALLGTMLFFDSASLSMKREVLRNPSRAVGFIGSFFIDNLLLGVVLKGLGIGRKAQIRLTRYLKQIPDRETREVTRLMFLTRKEIRKTFKIKDIGKIDLNVITKNKKISQALAKTLKETKSTVYGSAIEYEAKLQILKNFYKTKTKKQALDKFVKNLRNAKLTKTQIDDILATPKDIDLIINPKSMKKYVKLLQNQYRYVPELAQKFYLQKMKKIFPKTFKGYDFGLRELRKNKNFVFSVLNKTQIDSLLKELVTEPSIASFKIIFLQNLYKTGISPKILRNFDVAEKLALKGFDFAIDVHKSTDVAFTRRILGGLIKREEIPFEIGRPREFKNAIEGNSILINKLETAQKKAFLKLANKYKNSLRKVGFKVNPKTFQKNITRFLEKSDLRQKQIFDFLQTLNKKGVNKKILKTYYDLIDFSNLGINPQNFRQVLIAKNYDTVLKTLLDMAKKSARILQKYELDLSRLKAQREIMLYFSTGAKKYLRKALKFDVPDFKLKKTFTPKEQKLLIQKINNYNKRLQKDYNIKQILSQIDREYKGVVPKEALKDFKPTKTMLDLDKTVDRDLTFIKGFKTERIRYTPDGIRYITPSEQIKRRLAGAVSTVFEDRRAKDIKKLYDDLKFLEALKTIQAKRLISKQRKLLGVFDINRLLKSKIDRLKKLTRSIESDFFRKAKIISTKGRSETIGLQKIRFSPDLTKTQNKAITKTKKIISKIDTKLKKKRLTPQEIRLQKELLKESRSLLSQIRKYRKVGFRSLSLALASKSKSLGKKISKSLVSKISKSKAISRSISKKPSRSISISKKPSVSASLSVSKSPSRSISKSISKSASRSLSKSVSKSVSKSASRSLSKSVSKSVSKFPLSPTQKLPPRLPQLILKRGWKTKLPKNFTYVVNALIRVKGKNKLLNLKTTPNRALKKMIGLVDTTLSRSFQLIIVGVKKGKDIKKPSLTKFRQKVVGKNSQVLNIVEKTRYAIDTTGEKRALIISKIKQKRGKKVAKKKKKVKKTKKTKFKRKTTKRKTRKNKGVQRQSKGRKSKRKRR